MSLNNDIKRLDVPFYVMDKTYSVEDAKFLLAARGMPYEDGDEKRIIEGLITTEVADREDEIVLADGLDLTSFRTNPVLLWNHEPNQQNIGRSLSEIVTTTPSGDRGIKAVIYISSKEEKSNVILSKIKKRELSAFSIGFLPRKSRLATPDERKKYKAKSNKALIFTESELYEVTICNIPMNQTALITAVAKNLKGKEILTMDITPEALDEKIKKSIEDLTVKGGAKFSKDTMAKATAIHTELDGYHKGIQNCIKALKELFGNGSEETEETDEAEEEAEVKDEKKSAELYPLFPKEEKKEEPVKEDPDFESGTDSILKRLKALQLPA